jgi:hypothetical protein
MRDVRKDACRTFTLSLLSDDERVPVIKAHGSLRIRYPRNHATFQLTLLLQLHHTCNPRSQCTRDCAIAQSKEEVSTEFLFSLRVRTEANVRVHLVQRLRESTMRAAAKASPQGILLPPFKLLLFKSALNSKVEGKILLLDSRRFDFSCACRL